MSAATDHTPFDLAIVGAGWSGLACALDASDRGLRVALLDAAPQAGGRARAVEVRLGESVHRLDNGQHLLLGAYTECERLLRRVGVDPQQALLRLPLTMACADGFRFRAAALPAPLHLAIGLLLARGLTWADRLQLIARMRAWQGAGWRAAAGASAADVIGTVSARLRDRIFEPLCLGALNLRLQQADGQIFLNVLRDSMGAARRASDFWIAREDLSALFPDAAIAALHAVGYVALRTPVQALQQAPGGWKLALRDGAAIGSHITARAVVLALPPDRAAALLRTAKQPALDAAVTQLDAIEFAPIATVYLRYAAPPALAAPAMALLDSPATRAYGQWVFDRGALDRKHAGVWAVVISGRGEHLALPHTDLAHAVATQLSRELKCAAPLASAVIVEKHATVLATVGLMRPPAILPVDGLFLAGDAADSPYPSTLEGSVRAGVAAARAVSARWSAPHPAPLAGDRPRSR